MTALSKKRDSYRTIVTCKVIFRPSISRRVEESSWKSISKQNSVSSNTFRCFYSFCCIKTINFLNCHSKQEYYLLFSCRQYQCCAICPFYSYLCQVKISCPVCVPLNQSHTLNDAPVPSLISSYLRYHLMATGSLLSA